MFCVGQHLLLWAIPLKNRRGEGNSPWPPRTKLGFFNPLDKKKLEHKTGFFIPLGHVFSCNPPGQFCPILNPSDSFSRQFYPARTIFCQFYPLFTPLGQFILTILPPSDIFPKIVPPLDTFSWDPPRTKTFF